jgi:hypothetical protein
LIKLILFFKALLSAKVESLECYEGISEIGTLNVSQVRICPLNFKYCLMTKINGSIYRQCMLFCPIQSITYCCQQDLCNEPKSTTTITTAKKTISSNLKECYLTATRTNGIYNFLNTTCSSIENMNSYCYVSILLLS